MIPRKVLQTPAVPESLAYRWGGSHDEHTAMAQHWRPPRMHNDENDFSDSNHSGVSGFVVAVPHANDGSDADDGTGSGGVDDRKSEASDTDDFFDRDVELAHGRQPASLPSAWTKAPTRLGADAQLYRTLGDALDVFEQDSFPRRLRSTGTTSEVASQSRSSAARAETSVPRQVQQATDASLDDFFGGTAEKVTAVSSASPAMHSSVGVVGGTVLGQRFSGGPVTPKTALPDFASTQASPQSHVDDVKQVGETSAIPASNGDAVLAEDVLSAVNRSTDAPLGLVRCAQLIASRRRAEQPLPGNQSPLFPACSGLDAGTAVFFMPVFSLSAGDWQVAVAPNSTERSQPTFLL